MTILVTGGAGFIGSNFVRDWFGTTAEPIITLDKLTYAGHRSNLQGLPEQAEHTLVVGDIQDAPLIAELLQRHRPRAIVHFAAESHVDRSIVGPAAFIETNITGTFTLLEAARQYYATLAPEAQSAFRFIHVSTDEVYGSLGPNDAPFCEQTPYAPNSPYAASKAASDHLARAYVHTYGLPVITTHCSNNYGPYQLPEKLIPLCITRALAGETLPVYGDGKQVRDWLYVSDHCSALRQVLAHGVVGDVYAIGGHNEMENLTLVRTVCGLLDALRPRADGISYSSQITHVTDRLGHDRRYAINAEKIRQTLGFQPQETVASGLAKTVEWYVTHSTWIDAVTSERA